ncbi:MAG: GNAT family N-acetyltransferase [Anaerolineaceae bacterium]|jgi:ribosomal protein S18 acetylase RimI-like enzyme|nr:GNAT family N-acetyltransferase [Anaerolineaceae bacterium]MDD4578579.1 GNAT family N-acetyltransferase [Anaerolineaceae bacterium]
MQRIPLKMKRADLLHISEYELPVGFRVRFFEQGDEQTWAKIETAVDEFPDEAAALAHFENEFGATRDEMKRRCLFIENEHGEAIGTTTAWYGILEGETQISGRIHWVGVIPEYQGMKLSKPLLCKAMQVLAKYHDSAYLTSQTTSYQAINLYLNFGFAPYLTNQTDIEAWVLMEEVLDRKIL